MLRRVSREGAGKPVRVRRGRATVTGTRRPGSQNTASSRATHRRDASSRGGPLTRSPKAHRRLMRRLLLVRHGSTAAVRAAAFGADEPLDAAGREGAARLRARLPRGEVLVCPLRRAARDRRGPRRVAASSPDLAECDFGTWAGLTLRRHRPRRPRRLDDRPRRRAPRRRVPDRAARARRRVARRAGPLDGTAIADHPRRRRQGRGRPRPRRARRARSGESTSPRSRSPSCTPTTAAGRSPA